MVVSARRQSALLLMAIFQFVAMGARSQITEYRGYMSWSDTAIVDSVQINVTGPRSCYLLLDVPDQNITFAAVYGHWIMSPGLELLEVHGLVGSRYTNTVNKITDGSYEVWVTHDSCAPIPYGATPVARFDLQVTPNEFVPNGEVGMFTMYDGTVGSIDLTIGDVVCFLTSGPFAVEPLSANTDVVSADRSSFGSLKALYR